jgi:hypothetical protein
MNASKADILSEIQRTAADNGGKPLGWKRFTDETGVKSNDWQRYWARWGDALTEAGLAPNEMQARYEDGFLAACLAADTRRLGHFPTSRDLRVSHHGDPAHPDAQVFQRRWRRAEQIEVVEAYCRDRSDWADVLAIVSPLRHAASDPTTGPSRRLGPITLASVYLIKSGRYYKIGRTKAFARRMRELDTALAEGRKPIHIIPTDDPVGIEAYWHTRFKDRRRGDTEWFDLKAEDVAAFKRWRSM